MALQWEDKEVRFDIPYSKMKLINGEKVIDKLDNIEDTKGNSGFRGRLIITNIRVLWHSSSSPRINLSIGFGCILSTNTKMVNSRLRGTTQALQVLTLSRGTRYEFIFTNLVPGNTRHFISVMGVHKAYNSSKLYRELKLRGAVVHNKQLKILPLEQVVSTVSGVWNLSSDQGSLGTFIVTNVRFVWFADVNEGFNISLPYLQIDRIAIRDSKFGTALVITSSESSGLYVLGFKVDPEEKLKILFKELSSLHTVYTTKPTFGVEYKWTSSQNTKEHNNNIIAEFEAFDESKNEISNSISAYLADEGHSKDRLPAFCPELGLAVESIKEGYTLQKLWEVIPS
ncbi:Bardet-Biedl syndrome 5 protein homolog isoform X4 [Diabrotica virgifera virgifera]|uniref:Bardet-Biedl syndrome 5 protein homolog isoform X1 n=1 Tax=Diabrotica virgifera virgifera TaxID=50390 RepID=A0A6P7G633_DIAVI|nr:Bardet-Biedl syndrome 5 protein homolog isoform X1 [Diabrotica virgifera virgifera]XP_050511496.1 Bardet-Biedl syndrome 5 protein homolog isoform X2 [Diabrotica virgifera virgifera]XP_050511497.1 Bardet-Biedl syndrome 5 protein homolog isoform X3 [Diabrotica virgifera virgifera]XP_050511498.1 Bardet-Biedl syndrome 5 protein homolog isoform X4 [Diabrotica virgifera virgifera]